MPHKNLWKICILIKIFLESFQKAAKWNFNNEKKKGFKKDHKITDLKKKGQKEVFRSTSAKKG